MPNFDTKNQSKFYHCYNCETEINDINLKQCPNCGIILNPNHYVKWRNSFYSCICLLSLVPILIAIIISILTG